MGKSYSINGYVNAILRRSGKTLLVEGASDKAAIHRLLAEDRSQLQGGANIDHAGLIDDEHTRGLGNKDKIIHLRQVVKNLSESHPKLNELFASLVDREWDGLSISINGLSHDWHPPKQDDPHFVTFGHSIENYYLRSDSVIGFLKLCFPEYLTNELLVHLEQNFSQIIALAVAYSVHAKESNCIKKCGDLINRHNISYTNSNYHLNDSILEGMTSRQIASPDKFVHGVNLAVDSIWLNDKYIDNAQWLLHGHIGGEVVWACVAHAASQYGVPTDVAEQMERGHQKERERYLVDWLSQNGEVMNRQPLDTAVTWLTA